MGNESADCFRCIVLDSMNIMKKHFIMKHISFMMGKKALAAVLIMLSGGAGAFAQEWIDVTEGYIKNADYSEGNTGWTLTGDKITLNAEFRNAEIYDRKSSVSQQINGLPVGTYKVSVRGYYRAGNDGTAYTAHQNSSEVIQGYLFVDDATEPLVSVFSADPKPADVNLSGEWFEPSDLAGAGYPTSMEAMRKFLDAFPACYINELEFTVTADNPDVLIGIRTDGGPSGHWTCWSDFKLYVQSSTYDAFRAQLDALSGISSDLKQLGATAAAAELDAFCATYDGYSEQIPEEDLKAALDAVNEKMAETNGTVDLCTTFQEAVLNAETLLADCGGDGKYAEYAQCEQDLTQLETLVATTKSQLAAAAVAGLKTMVPEQTEGVNAEIDALHVRISFNYSLVNVKGLAEKIGGLTENAAYQKVESDLAVVDLTYDVMKADVSALKTVCVAAMTPAFLAEATIDNPIDLTSFIVNPNICQGNDATKMPDGWNEVNIDEMWWDGDDRTTAKNTDSDLFCYCWSGNDKNNIGNGWYYQQIGGADGSIDLPDGLYILKAATYSTRDDNAAYLYAGTENTAEATVKARINRDEGVYQTASADFSTTTITEVVEVRGGKLFIGMMGRRHNGEGAVGGNGNHWSADNFRLYYVGALETTVNLTMKVDWATLMLPFDAELQEGMTAYSCASVEEDGMLNLVKVEDGLKANVPYIINAATGSEFEFTGISCAEAETYKVGLLTGVHNETEAPVASYVLQNQESDGLAFYRVAENKQPKVGTNRAYLTLPETLGANVRVVYFPTDTDGVTDVEAADVMVDVYTLDGICVRSQMKKSEALKGLKGIYILKNVK